jgi:hypothetical protein
MDSFVWPKDEIWFLRVCHHISNAVYFQNLALTTYTMTSLALQVIKAANLTQIPESATQFFSPAFNPETNNL